MQTGKLLHGAGLPLEVATRNEEQALRRSELRYRRIFEAAGDGILILDADSGRIIDVNPYLVDLLGYARGEFLGRPLWDFAPFRDAVTSRQAFDELNGEAITLQPRDGRRLDVELVRSVYLEGDASTIQCNLRDLTRRQRRGLNQILASAEPTLRQSLGDDVELVYTLDAELGTTLADPGQLEQLVMNLMVDAGDAMPTGGRLSVETANVDLDAVYAARYPTAKAGPYVMLAVSDTGIGMVARTGLGLAIVHAIVGQCGGTLRVSGTVGRGTTFAIYLPRTPTD